MNINHIYIQLSDVLFYILLYILHSTTTHKIVIKLGNKNEN